MRMMEIWRATVPGHTSHSVLADPVSRSLFVSDGWGVAHSGLRLHRLDPDTGEELAEVRTRQQYVSAMTVADGSLYAVTHSRLLRLRPEDLAILDHWDRVLPSDAQQLLVSDGLVVAANFRKPLVGLFDPQRGASTRLRTGLQPLLVRHAQRVKVLEGFDGGVRTLDPERATLLGPEPCPPASAVAAGTEMWVVRAGAAQGVHSQGAPSSWLKPGTAGLLRLGGDREWEMVLPDAASAVLCDDDRGLVWCLVGERSANLVAVDQRHGWIVESFPAGPGRYWAYFHPPTGLAVTAEPMEQAGGYRATQSLSNLVGHVIVLEDWDLGRLPGHAAGSAEASCIDLSAAADGDAGGSPVEDHEESEPVRL